MLAYRLKDEERDNKHEDDLKKREDKRKLFRENCEKEYHLVFEEQDCSVSSFIIKMAVHTYQWQ